MVSRAGSMKSIAPRFSDSTAEVISLLADGKLPKGDVLATARIAGIMAAKRTADLIPLCHPLALTRVAVAFETTAAPVPRRAMRPMSYTCSPAARRVAAQAAALAASTTTTMPMPLLKVRFISTSSMPATFCSQARDPGWSRVRSRSSTNQKCVRKMCATTGSARARSD